MTIAEKKYFLDDSPKETLEVGDAFGHLYYARTIYRILENTLSPESFALGIFGIWGVGKTSIINELRRIIDKKSDYSPESNIHNYRLIQLDTWEYSENNFRREFLLELAGHFNCKDYIEIELTTKRVVEKKESPRYDLNWFKNLLIQFTGLLIIGIVGYLLLSNVNLSFLPEWASQLISLIVPTGVGLLATFNENIKQLFTFNTTLQETQPAVYPDEFKRLFSYIINDEARLKDKDRLCIVLDNLDRVKEEIVIQILSAVKTFLNVERCIYILPCDDKGLKQHIINSRTGESSEFRMTESEANEYLRKFFQTTLTIRDLLSEDLITFTRNNLDKLIIFDLPIPDPSYIESDIQDDIRKKNRDDVEAVFQVIITKNPRRIIQLANKLSANYLLAQEKRHIDPKLSSNILSNLGFLAKLTIIEEEWPVFYDFSVRNPDIYRQLNTYFITERKDAFPQLLEGFDISDPESYNPVSHEWNNGLYDFLFRTNYINVEHISDFLHLKQRPSAQLLPNFYQFRDAALTGNTEIVLEMIQSSPTEKRVPFMALTGEIHNQARIRNVPTLLNVIRSVVSSFVLIPDTDHGLRVEISNSIAEQVSRENLSERILYIGLTDLLSTLHFSSRASNIDSIINSIIGHIQIVGNPTEAIFISDNISKNINLVSQSNRKIFKDILEHESEGDEYLQTTRDIVQLFLTANSIDLNEFVPQSVYVRNIQLLERPGEVADKTLGFLEQLMSFMDDNTLDFLTNQIVSHLSTSSEAMTPQIQLALNIIDKIPLDVLRKLNLSIIVKPLASRYGSLTAQNHKMQIANTYLQILELLGNDDQVMFHPHLIHATQQSSPGDLLKIISSVKHKGVETYNLQDDLNAIRQRSITHIGNEEVRLQFFDLATSLERSDEITQYITSITDNPDELILSLEVSESFLNAEDFRSTLRELFTHVDTLPETQIAQFLQNISKFEKKFDKGFRRELTERILNNWLRKPSLEIRQGAYNLWKSFRDKDQELCELLHERLIEYASDATNNNTVDKDLEFFTINMLVEDIDFISEENKSNLLKLGLRMVEKARPDSIRQKGYSFLGRLNPEEIAKSLIPNELLTDFEEETGPEILRAIHNSLTMYKDQLDKSQKERILNAIGNRDDHPLYEEIRNYWIETLS